MSVCWLALCSAFAWRVRCVSQLPRQELCPLRLVKFMTFKFHSPSLSQCISLSLYLTPSPLMSALRFACYSRRNFRAHTYGKYLKVFALFLAFHCFPLSFCLSLPLAHSTLIATKLMTMWVISISSVCRKAA